MVQLVPKLLTTKGHDCCCFEVFPVYILLYAWGLAGNLILLEFQVSWWLLYFAALIWPSSLKTFNRSLQHHSLWRWCISDFTLIFWHICIRDMAAAVVICTVLTLLSWCPPSSSSSLHDDAQFEDALLLVLLLLCHIFLIIDLTATPREAQWHGNHSLVLFNYGFIEQHGVFFFFMVFHSADSFMLQSIESPWVHKSYLTSYLTQ